MIHSIQEELVVKPCSGLLIIIVLLFLAIAPVSATQGNAKIVVASPTGIPVGTGSDVVINISHTIDVDARDNPGILTMEFQLGWDDSIASWKSQVGTTNLMTNWTNHLNGPVTLNYISQKKIKLQWISGPLAQGQSTIITLHNVTARTPAATPLHISNVFLTDMAGNQIDETTGNLILNDGAFIPTGAPAAATQTTVEPTTQIPQSVPTEPGIAAKTPPVPTAAPTRSPLDIVVVAGALVIGVTLFARKKR
jgi:hypothetical protein